MGVALVVLRSQYCNIILREVAVQGGISINEPPHLEMAFTINFFGQLGMVCGVVLVANQ